MLRWLCAAVVTAVLTGFAFLLVTGNYLEEGAVLARVSTDHGVHQGDVFVVLGWAVSVAAVLVLARGPRRRTDD
jgi:hypothetical protein